ncbi:MAG: hypothetical protein VX794_05660 [Nitrospinota bacterium]|nr:hypothetical protein [Nitrospinota bacterium]
MKFVNRFSFQCLFTLAISFFLATSFLGCGSERFENSKKLLAKITPEIPSISPGDVVDKIATSIPFMQDDPIMDVPRGSVSISTKPYGGMVFFNGTNRGRAIKGKPVVLRGIKFGSHSLTARFPEMVSTVFHFRLLRKTTTFVVPIHKNSRSMITFHVSPAPAEIFVGSKFLGNADSKISTKKLGVGSHRVWIRKKGFLSFRFEIEVNPILHHFYFVEMIKNLDDNKGSGTFTNKIFKIF